VERGGHEYRELDAERVLVQFRFTVRGKRSGLELGQIRTTGASLFHVRDGRVAKLVQYLDLGLALDDLGLARD
jgi:ketosteroid isomerase-like protein